MLMSGRYWAGDGDGRKGILTGLPVLPCRSPCCCAGDGVLIVLGLDSVRTLVGILVVATERAFWLIFLRNVRNLCLNFLRFSVRLARRSADVGFVGAQGSAGLLLGSAAYCPAIRAAAARSAGAGMASNSARVGR